jgi:thiamine pyrophosphate-dependent acetolactate synthase large subunit-like protein
MPDTNAPPPVPDGAAAIERPASLPAGNTLFGSDAVAEALRALDIPFIALNPGASYRGLHDSLVNHLGNSAPQMLLCLHEEHAVAIAQGWAKVTGRPMLAAVHSNVGLFHATMAIFNAWCDRMPVIVLGATGPVDAAKRRPWIDWIHTAQDQGAIVRSYVKWDAQPASPAAAREAVFRAAWLAGTAPCGPVYVNLDAAMQEAPLTEPLAPVDPARYMPAVAAGAPADLVAQAAALLQDARRPLILMGRVGRDEAAWATRLQLAEALGARVMTDLKVGAAFPTDHALHAGVPGVFPVPAAVAALAEADVVLSLDWVDLAGTLKTAFAGAAPSARIIQVSLDHVLNNGWSSDHQGLPPVDLFIAADPDATAAALPVRPSAPPPRRRRTHDPTPKRGSPCRTWQRHCGARWAHDRSRCCICRCRGMAGSGRSAIRSISWARMAAAASAAVPAFRSARPWRCAAAAACRSRSAATATSSWASPRYGPPRITASRCCSWWPTTSRSSTTRSIRNAWRASAAARSRTSGSASA